MSIITALKPQKNQKRVNVYVDGEFAFGVDLENLVKFGIKVEKEFSSEELNKIIHQAEFQKTFDKLLRFVMTRPRSTKEVNDWFKRKKVPEELHAKLIKRLEKLDLINDQAFAKWWIDQRIQFRKKGIRALKMELSQKGINREIIDQVLEDQNIDEAKMAKELLSKKAYKWERFDDQKKRQKQIEFLLRNGFDWEVVKKATGE